jgi:hypothetical protein
VEYLITSHERTAWMTPNDPTRRPDMPLFPREIGAFRGARRFAWAFGGLQALMIAMVVSNLQPAAISIWLFVLIPVTLGCRGAALGKWCVALKIWHMSHLFDTVAPSAPTPAKVNISMWLEHLKTTLVMIRAGGAGFYFVGFSCGILILVLPFIAVISAWIAISGVVRPEAISRAETVARDITRDKLPRNAAQIRRRKRDHITVKTMMMVLSPVAITQLLCDVLLVPDASNRALMIIVACVAIGCVIARAKRSTPQAHS